MAAIAARRAGISVAVRLQAMGGVVDMGVACTFKPT